MMKVVYLTLPDRVPDTAWKQDQPCANHSAERTFWLRKYRAVMQRGRPNGMAMGRVHGGNEAYRETRTHARRKGRPVATFADL